MSKAHRHIFAMLLFPLAFGGCISEITIDDDFKKKEVVLNCILNTQKDTVYVQLSHSKPIQEIDEFEPVVNARIQLFENGEKVGEFLWSDSSTYILPFSVLPGKIYRIEATAGNNKVWAETTVPNTINATIEKDTSGLYNYYTLGILLNDNTEEVNYYWISATGFEGIGGNRSKNIACALYSNFEYADDFNQTIYQNGSYKFEYEYYIRFADNVLPDGKTEIIFYPQCISNPIEVFLLSTDYHLDKYMKSSLLLQNMDLYAEDMPITYAPFPMYSNINGGTGIFGSYNSVSEKFGEE
ncbi:MAG: DUF4249 domain-containing protein [Draconibacterium sp.]